MFESDFFSTGRAWLIIQTRATKTQQIGLQTQRQLPLSSLNQADSFLPGQSCNFFFSQVTWVLNLPILAYSSVSCWSLGRFNFTVLSFFSKKAGIPFNSTA